MALRTGHGRGRGKPRIEVLPGDELPVGIQADTRPPDLPGEVRSNHGHFPPGNPLAASGGRGKRGSSKLAIEMASKGAPVTPEMHTYVARADRLRRVVCQELARDVGGGQCSAAVSAIVLGASRARMWAQRFGDIALSGGADIDLVMKSMRLEESCKSAFAMAQELCAKQAQSRPVQKESMAWLTQGSAEAQNEVVEEVAVVEEVVEPVEAPSETTEAPDDQE